MHQKQPPAKIAVLVFAGGKSCAWARSTIAATETMRRRTAQKCFILSILDTAETDLFASFALASARSPCHKHALLNKQEVRNMVKTAATLFGIVFLAIGILGFVPGITTNDMLLGIFMFN